MKSSKSKLGALIAGATIATTLLGSSPAQADDDSYSAAQIESAQLTADLMTNAIVAALVQIIGDTTVDNVEAGNKNVTLLLGDRNDAVRLIGSFSPLEPDTAEPEDDFEVDALALALQGEGLEIVDDGELRRSVPLQYSVSQCGLCHDEWADQGIEVGDYVGALILNVPIGDRDDD